MQIVAVALAIGWVPIGWRFIHTYRTRANPISLSIAQLVFLMSYGLVMSAWCFSDQAKSTQFTLQLLYVVCTYVCVNFYISFWQSNKLFKTNDQRKSV